MIVTVTAVCRWEWIVHVVSLDDERSVKKQLEGKPGGRRNKGRPRLRWTDDVELDLRNMGVTKWRSRALDRTQWTPVVREAKAKLSEL
jgi:hypothetical protein